MIYLLDTNVCVCYLRNSNEKLVSRLLITPTSDVGLSSVVLGELWFGVYRSSKQADGERILADFTGRFTPVAFDEVAASIYGKLRRDLESLGTKIGPYDLQIAATALANDLILVTHNTKEFQRVAGLRLEDWEVD